MVNIRSVNEIILSLIDFFKVAQPDLDYKPGTVARDLFIDAPASQLSLLYDELSNSSNKQSLRLVVGSDLDKLAKNFGIVRKSATTASGVALMTFASINAAININKGDTVIASNGFTYKVANGVTVTPNAINFYRSIASKYSDQLAFVGISDQYAVEVTVVANTAGSNGNIGAFSLSRTSIASVSNVTNIVAFTGGTDQESDVSFRNRVLSSFTGSSVGTALGYLNVALSVTGVSDAAVIEPGDSLMTRDGTVVSVATDGTRTIVSEGSGGKVDVVVLGTSLIQNTDSYIYLDKSNSNDPTNSKNDIVLGQIAADAGKTINKKRIDDIANGALPAQPVTSIISVTGSLSGSNFSPKSVDSLGRISGNYELVKDTGVFNGSPWAADRLHWINNVIPRFSEDVIKGQFNGQDATTFSDVTNIPQVTQNISITNENSLTTSDRSIIQLLHTPATNVTRVLNVNTGERYLISDQNPDKTGVYNTSGRIKISGNTLPSTSDVLQVDYNWIVDYDPHSDYDGLQNTYNQRLVNDSIDWGYSSTIKNEKVTLINSDGNFFTGTTTHPISTVLTASIFNEVAGTVFKVASGLFVNRLAVTISHLPNSTKSVDAITLKNTNIEVYVTAQNDGSFSTVTEVFGIDVLYNTTIILPTDTSAVVGDIVSVVFNKQDVFNSGGSSSSTQITIPAAAINTTATSIVLLTTYIASVTDLISTSTSNIPTSRAGNGFVLFNNNGFSNFSSVNVLRRDSLVVQKNLSNQYYIETSLPAVDFTFTASSVVSVIRLSDGKELWNSNNLGSVTTGNSGNYQVILNGINAPATGDRVLFVYYAVDKARFQPFSYINYLISNRTDQLSTDPTTNRLYVPLNQLTSQLTGLQFTILEPNTNIVLSSITDGYMIVSGGIGKVTSLSINFNVLAGVANKKLQIINAIDPNNNGIYDILGYDPLTNQITISNIYNHITQDQISIIRLLDGKEVWNYSGTINVSDNKLLLPAGVQAVDGDNVYVVIFSYNNLRKSPTKLISTTTDQTINSGLLTLTGTTLFKAADIVFTATNTGLHLNAAEAIRKALNISSVTNIPSNIKLAKIIKLEKVATASANSEEVISVLTTYDTKNTTLQNNLLFSDEMLSNSGLSSLDFILPSTSNNTLNTDVVNLPKLGDKLRVTLYYSVDGDSESLSYTRNGSLYTNKKFALINRVYVASGFKSSLATKLVLTSFTQPSLGSRYKIFYDYLAPKQNERISINFNSNKIISDVTFNIENTRPINADVIVRAAKQVLLDLTMNVVISSDYINSSTTVIQNLKDKLITAMTTTQLGQVVDVPTLINVAQSVSGISRARVLYFNKTGSSGQVLSIQAQKDEYFSSNTIVINTETR